MRHSSRCLVILLVTLGSVPRNDGTPAEDFSSASSDQEYNGTIGATLGHEVDDADVEYSGDAYDAILVQHGPVHDVDAPEETYGGQDQPSDILVDDAIEIETLPSGPTERTLHVAWLVATSAVIALGALVYGALAIYRSRLAHRYGMRQLLVIDESYYHNNETRDFEGSEERTASEL